MADPDRDTVYTRDGTTTNRTIYSRESNSTGWFVGIIVALALLAIAYLVFSANSQPSTTSVDVNNTPAITTPAPADNTTTPMAPVDNGTGTAVTPAVPAPTAPANTAPSVAPSAPATDTSAAPVSTAPSAAVSSIAPATSSAAQ